MKKILTVIAAAALMTACGPSRHSVHVEMRHPSKAGVDLAGKTVSVVYLENDNQTASAFVEGMADGFAYALEQDYATGEGSVGIYRMRQSPGGIYSSKDSLVNLLIDTDADVVFLFDTVAVGTMSPGGPAAVASPSSADSSYVSAVNLPFKMKLYCFDAMDKKEKVYNFSGSSVAVMDVYSDGKQSLKTIVDKASGVVPQAGWESGMTVADSFKSQWKHEQYSIVYFDGSKWYDALAYAENYDWKAAMDIWIGLLDTNDMLRRSCAEYNLSVACYMLGDYDLAEKWLDRSDADNLLPVSDAMRKRINSRK